MKSSLFKPLILCSLWLLAMPALMVSPSGAAMAGFPAPKVLTGTPGLGIRDIQFYGDYAICRSELGIVVLRMHSGDSAEFVTDFGLGAPLGSIPSGHFRPRIVGSLAYVPDWSDGLWIVDLSNPESPAILSGSPIAVPARCREVLVRGDYAYVGTSSIYSTGLMTFDISDPTDPLAVGTNPTPMDAFDMVLKNSHLYVVGYHTYTFSLAQPAVPELLDENSVTGRAYGIRSTDDQLYVADLWTPSGSAGALTVFSRSDTTVPLMLGREPDILEHSDADVVALGSRVIALTLSGLLHVVDISDPYNPQRIVAYDTYIPCIEGLTLSGDYLYAVDQVNGVYAYRLTNRGDCNSDGIHNSGDIIWLVNYIFRSGPSPSPLEQGDVNCDGVVTSADIIFLVNYVFKSGPPPFC